jgi:hypothetical protein
MEFKASWTAIWTMARARDCCCAPPKRGATRSATAFQSVTTSAAARPGVVATIRNIAAARMVVRDILPPGHYAE